MIQQIGFVGIRRSTMRRCGRLEQKLIGVVFAVQTRHALTAGRSRNGLPPPRESCAPQLDMAIEASTATGPQSGQRDGAQSVPNPAMPSQPGACRFLGQTSLRVKPRRRSGRITSAAV